MIRVSGQVLPLFSCLVNSDVITYFSTQVRQWLVILSTECPFTCGVPGITHYLTSGSMNTARNNLVQPFLCSQPISERKFDSPGEQRTLWHLATASKGGFSFGTERVEPGCLIPRHHHTESDELIFIYRGTARCVIGDNSECQMNEGDSVCIQAGTFHEIRNGSDTDPLLLTWTLSPPQTISQFQANANPGPSSH